MQILEETSEFDNNSQGSVLSPKPRLGFVVDLFILFIYLDI